MKTTVLGWYNHGNIGDEAYKIAFPKIFPDHELTFTDLLPEGCERVFLGGGDVIQTYFLDQLKKTKIPKYAMSVNIKCPDIPKHLESFQQLFIRNVCSTSEKVMSMPDFTFVLQPDPARGKKLIDKIFEDQRADRYERVIAVVMNAYLCSDEAALARDHIAFDKLCYDLAKLMDNTNASFLLLPFGNGFPHNDRLAASCLYPRCKYWKKNACLFRELSVQGTLDVISACNMLIGTRLHASIFACIGGTPFVDLTHHDKTALFLESINKDWNVNYWNFSTERLKVLMADFSVNEKQHRHDLLSIAERNRKLLLELTNHLRL